MYTKNEYLDAFRWNFGFTKKEADETYKAHKRNGDLKHLDLCVEGFRRNSYKSFYNDYPIKIGL